MKKLMIIAVMALFALVSMVSMTLVASAATVSGISIIPISSQAFNVSTVNGQSLILTGEKTTVRFYAPDAGTLNGGIFTYASNQHKIMFLNAMMGGNVKVSKGQLLREANQIEFVSMDENFNTITGVQLLWNGQAIDGFASTGKTFVMATRVDWVKSEKVQITRNHTQVWQMRSTYIISYFDGSKKTVVSSTDITWVKVNHTETINHLIEGRNFKTLATSLSVRNSWNFKLLVAASQR